MIITTRLGFLIKIYNKFKAKLDDIPVDEISVANNVELCPIFVPYVGEASIRFVKALSRLCLKQFHVRLLSLYRTNKVGQYFLLKSETPLHLCSNVFFFCHIYPPFTRKRCIAMFCTGSSHSLGSCHFRVTCLPLNGGASR